MTLNVKSFALTCGLFWGFCILLVTWWIMLFEGATGDLLVIGHVYRGFNVSPLGSIIGLIWGFFDGLVGGAIFAGIYNFLTGRMKKAA
jgi:hypothetical protein